MPPRIFISYRRDDAAGEAGRLADHLIGRFGDGQVFLDIDTIDPGKDFVQVLQSSLRETAAVLVVIGNRWTSARDGAGARRLDDVNDFVRLEVEQALSRDIPVVPVLVQGATMPRREDLPPSIVSLSARQAVALDHAEFRDDVHRLCDQLEKLIGRGSPASTSDEIQVMVGAAMAQRRRRQFGEALSTLSQARTLAPSSATVRQAQEDLAMDWIRNVRGSGGTTTFGEAIRPAIAVVDGAVASATGERLADLLAHQGWVMFLLRRDGDSQLDPGEMYREALSIDPTNPYANAMLAHWRLFRDHDDVATAVSLFETALRSGRASDEVRKLQWAAYGNANNPEAEAERLRVADAMRRAGESISMEQAQDLWGPYYFALSTVKSAERAALLDALPPDDHISTIKWAFREYAAKDESRLRVNRFYVALLQAKAGRTDPAIVDLEGLKSEMTEEQLSGSLEQALTAALEQLRSR